MVRRHELVPRRRLLAHLIAAPEHVRLVLVVAPPGYGKTVVLSQWAAVDPRRFAWLSADPADRDPGRLIHRIARALHQIEPLDATVWRGLSAPGEIQIETTASRVSGAAPERPWVLVIDDFDRIADGPAAKVVTAMVENLPPGCQIAIASRSRAGLAVGRMRSDGVCIEFGPVDLRLSRAESMAVLSAAGARLPAQHAARLTRRFGGWPAGIYLAGLSVRSRPDTAAAADRVTGAEPFLTEYFRDVVLADESDETVQFLLRTSPLGEMTPALCDVALGRSGSANMLAGIAARSVFLETTDPAVPAYRYHPIFREALLSELRRWHPAEEVQIHRRASFWHEGRGQAAAAASHAVAAGDTLTVRRLVTNRSRLLIQQGTPPVLRDSLEMLPAEAIQRDPWLAAEVGWIRAFGGDATGAGLCLAAAEKHQGGWTSATAPVARLRAALAPGGLDDMLTHARRAAAGEMSGSDWYATTLTLLGIAELLTGDDDRGLEHLNRAAQIGADRPIAAGLALAYLAWRYADRGNERAAGAYAEKSAALLSDRLDHYPWSVMTHLVHARAAWFAGDGYAYRRLVGEARRVLYTARPFPWLSVHASLVLARLSLEASDVPAAERAAAEAGRLLDRMPSAGVLAEVYRRLMFDIGIRTAAADPGDQNRLTAAEQRVLRLLPTHLTLSEIAGELNISRNTVKTQVAAVYRKLSAPGRAAAVREGRDLGLLD